MSENLISAAYAVGNVVSSVVLVLVNKRVFAAGFHYPITLSCFHFVFTVVFYRVLAACAVYAPKNPDISSGEKFKVGLAGVCSIGFMNMSLSANSVGFYQITKLTIVPVTLLINYYHYGVTTNGKVKLALAILLFGVGVATVTDVELRPLGLCYGVVAILTTATYQIWQGTKQREFEMSGTQLQGSIAFWQAFQTAVGALLMEAVCYTPPPAADPCDSALAFLDEALLSSHPHHGKRGVLTLVLLTCFLALCVNWCSFGLIGRTSPITFQVVGHAKTCLVLAGGYLMFPAKETGMDQLRSNVTGVCVAMVGVVLYGHIKHAASQEQPDCIDRFCPRSIAGCLGGAGATALSTVETDPLSPDDSEEEDRKGSGRV